MRTPFHPSTVVRSVCLLSLTAVFLFAGCGKVLGWYQQVRHPHSVTIAWTAGASPVQGYNVYRASPPGAPVKLTAKIVTETRYVDKTVEGGRTYSYYVTSVDSKGMESGPSANITVTVPRP